MFQELEIMAMQKGGRNSLDLSKLDKDVHFPGQLYGFRQHGYLRNNSRIGTTTIFYRELSVVQSVSIAANNRIIEICNEEYAGDEKINNILKYLKKHKVIKNG